MTENLSRDLVYRVLVDGVEQASGFANQFRADLASICAGGTCAFDIFLWPYISPGLPHTILVQGQNFMTGEWFNLANSPKVLTCRESCDAHPDHPSDACSDGDPAPSPAGHHAYPGVQPAGLLWPQGGAARPVSEWSGARRGWRLSGEDLHPQPFRSHHRL